jgi:mono/diheme cytochrome c family protein
MSILHWPVVIGVVAFFVALHFLRQRTFAWTLGVFLGVSALIRYALVVPIPASVISIYTFILLLALTAYVTSSERRREEFLAPLDATVNEPRRRLILVAILVLLPVGAAARAYLGTKVKLEAPAYGRTVHPAPPDSISVRDKTINLGTARNPYRELEKTDPAAFRAHVASGKVTYYKNCVFCHGDALAGDGMFVHALNPIPTNFTDKGTIPMLQEAFLFWRISKGGPGLPAEGGPWDSAMPQWEKFLKEEEIWDVILFLYDQTGSRPRAEGEVEH